MTREAKIIAMKQISPYVSSDIEAAVYMGIGDPRLCAYLVKEGMLVRYPRQGKKHVYRIEELIKCAEAIDSKLIVLPDKP